MKFVIDESVDKQIADLLKINDFDVLYITDTYSGISDEEVLKLANSISALILTADKDFGE